MENDNYPTWCCLACAIKAEAEISKITKIEMHLEICDICNKWTEVCSPKEFNYPRFTLKRDRYKIYSQLMDALDESILKSDFPTCMRIVYAIDEIIHEILESKGIYYESTRVLSRKQRRKAREEIRRTVSSVRKDSKRAICEDFFFEQDHQRSFIANGNI